MGNNALPEFERANVGDYVEFGRYPQTEEGEVLPVEWQVLARENNRVLIISRYGLDARRFDESSNNWGSSEIRKWLNGEFYTGSFTAEEKAFIESFNQDNIFLLSKKEAEKYFADEAARKCKLTAYAKAKVAFVNDDFCSWWLRSPSPYGSDYVYNVSYDGYVDSLYVLAFDGSVRPALWISFKSYSNPFKNANVGNYVKFGRYPQTAKGDVHPVKWRVLAIEDNKALVISHYGLDARLFDSESNDWSESEIRWWLNGEFYNSTFSYKEKALIKSFNQDNVFLLSDGEAEKYFANSDERKCKPTSYAKAKGALTGDNDCGYWWLRSSYPYNSDIVFSVNCYGDVNFYYDVYDNYGSVRPALWVSLEF